MGKNKITVALAHIEGIHYRIMVDISHLGVLSLSYDFENFDAAEKFTGVVAEYIENFGLDKFLEAISQSQPLDGGGVDE